MKTFNKATDFLKELAETSLRAPLKTHSLNYPNHNYACGCSYRAHIVADKSNSIFAYAPKGVFAVRFVIRCQKDYFTLVHMKGFLKIEAITEWTVSKKIFNECLKIIKLPDVDSVIFN